MIEKEKKRKRKRNIDLAVLPSHDTPIWFIGAWENIFLLGFVS